jgi:hypothetical protein
MSYLRELPNANMQDFLYGTDSETPYLLVDTVRTILKCESQLTHKDRELQAVFVLSLNNAMQPIHVHSRNFALLGGDRSIVQDLVRDPQHRAVPENYRPLFNILRKSTEKSDSVCQADIDACYDAGWNGHTIHLVATLVGMFNAMPRWVNTLGMKYDEEEVIGSSDYLINQGYGPDDRPSLTDEQYKERYPDYKNKGLVMSEQQRVKVSE